MLLYVTLVSLIPGGVKVQTTEQATNGVTYFRAVLNASQLTPALKRMIPLFCEVATKYVFFSLVCYITCKVLTESDIPPKKAFYFLLGDSVWRQKTMQSILCCSVTTPPKKAFYFLSGDSVWRQKTTQSILCYSVTYIFNRVKNATARNQNWNWTGYEEDM